MRINHLLFILLGWLVSCQNDDLASISSSAEIISHGKSVFEQFCIACHGFDRAGIGPHLGGLTREVESEWIAQFIRDPRKMIQSGDERAEYIYAEYQTMMPSFQHLAEADIQGLIAYMHTHDEPNRVFRSDEGLVEVKDPVPDTIIDSDLVISLELYGEIPASAQQGTKTRINQMVCDRSTGRTFVVDLRGQVYQISDGEVDLYFDLNEHLENFKTTPGQHTGLGSIAFHPDFRQNGLIYMTHAEPAKTAIADQPLPDSLPSVLQYVLSEWQTTDPEANVLVGSHRELMRIDFVTGKHGMQELAFNPHAHDANHPDYGLLYLGVGDGACVEEGYPDPVLNLGIHLWGTILRIDPRRQSDGRAYGIPADNPFVTDPEKRGEIYAGGFRNPNKLHWDQDGKLYATDIGLRNGEELNHVVPGKSYGWPYREGSYYLNFLGNQGKVYEVPETEMDNKFQQPALERDHDDLRAITGGFFCESRNAVDLNSCYLFGDIPEGSLFFCKMQDLMSSENPPAYRWRVEIESKVGTLRELSTANRIDLRIGQDCAGDLFLFTKWDGKIWKARNYQSDTQVDI